MAYRLDRGQLRPPERLSDGRLRVDGFLTRAGVFIYRQAGEDGQEIERREYRPDGEVFSESSMVTFSLVPLTNDHPAELLNSKNIRDFIVGTVGESIRKVDGWIAANLMVYDQDTIKKMEAGKVELSCGYECDVDNTPGIAPDGQRYDAVQRNIRGNHVALVDVARAGHTARVRMDAATMSETPAERPAPMAMTEEEKKELKKAKDEAAAQKKRADSLQVKLDAKKPAEGEGEEDYEDPDEEKEDDDEDEKETPTFMKKKDKGKKDKSTKKDSASYEKLLAEKDAAEARARIAERKLRRDGEQVKTEAKERIKLISQVGSLLGETVRLDGKEVDLVDLETRDIKRTLIEHVDGDDVSADRSDEYIDGRFDSCIARADEAEGDFDALEEGAERFRIDGDTGNAVNNARQKMIQSHQDAWKKGAN